MMTHDELKTMIEDKFNNHTILHDAQIVNALYRVVELHREVDGGCSICTADYWAEDYPCQTIQAIEAEL
jgi:hypothetical protein